MTVKNFFDLADSFTYIEIVDKEEDMTLVSDLCYMIQPRFFGLEVTSLKVENNRLVLFV